MRQVRMAAALLAMVTALIGGLFLLLPHLGAGIGVVAPVVAAAACLAATAPFDTVAPAARRRVVVACIAFVGAIVMAMAMAARAAADLGAIGVLAMLAAGGTGLAAWAFKVRNRRRRPGLSSYYDY